MTVRNASLEMEEDKLKKMLRVLGLLTGVLMMLTIPLQAIANNQEVFDAEFCAPLNPEPDRPFGVREVASLDETIYGYLGEAIYTWKPGDLQPERYCSLPPIPEWKEKWRGKKYKDLSVKDQAALGESVDYIASGDGALWGYNLYSGKFGKITEQGIEWQKIKLDTSCLFREGSVECWAVPIISIVEGGRLYVFADNAGVIDPISEPTALLRYDLSSGEYEVLHTKTAINICRYTPGNFLLLRRGDASSMILSTMDTATGAIEDVPLRVPFPDMTDTGLESVGGLAYDPMNDQICFSMKEQVWKSVEGKPFESVAHLPTETYYRMPGWFLSDGRYAILASSLFVREVD